MRQNSTKISCSSFKMFHENLFHRKYDDIVSVNQESVVGMDVEKVRKLLEEAETDLNLVCRSKYNST